MMTHKDVDGRADGKVDEGVVCNEAQQLEGLAVRGARSAHRHTQGEEKEKGRGVKKEWGC